MKDCRREERTIEILKELVLEFVDKEWLVNRIITLEQARTQYFDLPESWIIDEEDENE